MEYFTHQFLCVLLTLYLNYRGISGATENTSSQPTAIYSPALPPGLCEYDFTGPSDDIFIIDRSRSFNLENFNSAKAFIQDLIQRSFYLRPGQNHIAVFTFANKAVEVFDFVSKEPMYPECELFLPGGLWEKVALRADDMTGENLQDAVDMAWLAFGTSLRKDDPSVNKRLWLMTDFHEISPDIHKSRFSGVDIYGFSAGANIDHQNFFSVIDEDKISCNYRMKRDWSDAQTTFATVEKNELEPVSVLDKGLCGENCTHGCACYEFQQLPTPGDPRCTADDDKSATVPGEAQNDMELTIIIAASASAVGFLVLVAILVFVCLCCRKTKDKPEQNPVPTLSRPQGTNTDTMSTTMTGTDASTYTNSTLLTPVNTARSNTSSTHTSMGNSHIHTISETLEQNDEPVYINGELGKILVEHGIAQDTLAKNKKKETHISPPSDGKLYKKNPGMKHSDGYFGKHYMHGGHNRNASDLSEISTTPSYIVPIPDDQSSVGGGAYKYSYPYLDTHCRSYEEPSVPGSKTPTSSHSYEKFTFPSHGNREEHNNNVTHSGITAELASKLSKLRKKAEPVKYTDFNDEGSSTAGTSNGDAVAMRFPHRILPANPAEKQKEETPMYVDPEQRHEKHSSAKLGTMKFKNLFYMFSNDDITGVNKTVAAGSSVTTPDYSEPYSVHPGMPNTAMSQPFREIM